MNPQDKNRQEITITASVSGGTWSYITNQNGNSLRMSLMGYGSCTPQKVLQDWLNSMSYEDKVKLSKEIDKRKDIHDRQE